MLFAARAALLPDSMALVPALIDVDNERFGDVRVLALGEPLPSAAIELDGIVSPGFIDVHCHGGGGATLVTDDVNEARTAIATHLAHGTTSLMASLVSGYPEDLLRYIAALDSLVRRGELLGIHMEGPWISPFYRGAHAADTLADPSVELLNACAAAGGVALLTIAPELPGAKAVIERARELGIVAAIGHTAAHAEDIRQAFGWGATGATHLFNAMPDLKHRVPGPVLPCFENDSVWLELIADGTHVNAELVRWVIDSFAARIVLITDAMGAAGANDGEYMLGALPVTVRGGVAYVSGTETIAGSTLTLDAAVRKVVSLGVPVANALQLATAHPADYLGLNDVGRIAVGKFADLVVLDETLEVQQVMRHGRWCTPTCC